MKDDRRGAGKPNFRGQLSLTPRKLLPFLRLFDSHELMPQLTGRHDGKIPDPPKVEQLPVAGHEHIGFPGQGAREDGVRKWGQTPF
jgi:hypothetical protein